MMPIALSLPFYISNLKDLKYIEIKNGPCNASVCVSVCLSVCVCVRCFLVNKFQPNGWTDLDVVFKKMVAYRTGSNPIEIGDLGSKVKVTMTLYPFFLHISQLTSLLWISALLCRIIMKFSSSLRYALGRFVFEFDKIWMGDDVIVTSFKFSANNCPYLKFYWTYKLHTWYQCTTT